MSTLPMKFMLRSRDGARPALLDEPAHAADSCSGAACDGTQVSQCSTSLWTTAPEEM